MIILLYIELIRVRFTRYSFKISNKILIIILYIGCSVVKKGIKWWYSYFRNTNMYLKAKLYVDNRDIVY